MNLPSRISKLVGAVALTIVAISPFQIASAQQDQNPAAPTGTIVDTAIAAGSFTTLVAALQATDLVSVLADQNASLTVFAPTDEAFAALGQGTIDALLADPATLTDILLYHIVPGEIDAATATAVAPVAVATVNSAEIAISVADETLFINSSAVINPDIFTSNGVIHVIDSVLIPPADEPEPQPLNIVGTAVEAGGFGTLVDLLVATGLDTVLADESTEYTVFAPTDAAFEKLGTDTLNALAADPELLKDILLYHVLGGQSVDATTAISLAGNSVETANGDSIALSIRDGALFINDSEVVQTDIPASNGIIHVIDTVLIPPADDAAQGPTLAEFVADNGNFRILNYALHATGLDETLNDTAATFTVFAPTDRAFFRLGYRNLIWLFRHPEILKSILLYHVIPDTAVDAATALTLDTAAVTTVNGQDLTIRVFGEHLFINRSWVIATDFEASNGVAHAINRVLIPNLH